MTEPIVYGFSEAELLFLLPALRSFATRFTPNANDADDLVQETVVKAWSKMEKFTSGTSLKSWLFTILRNTYCTRYRSAKREVPLDTEFLKTMYGTLSEQEWHAHMSDFISAFSHLPSFQQNVVVEILVHGESYESVSERTGCPVGTIKSRVNRARKKLQIEIGYEGFV